jgi:hypothetical protein
MKAIPYFFIALTIAILSGSIGTLFAAYFELVHPTVVRKGTDDVAPASGYWFVGSVLVLFASAILFWTVQFLRGGINTSKKRLELSAPKPASLEPGILISRPGHPLTILLQPLLMVLAIYQIPFVVLFAVYREQWNRNWFASAGSAAILLLVTILLVRTYRYRMAVGDLHLELDDAPELDPNQLTGRIVLNRQSDSRSASLVLVLKLYENRDRTTQRIATDFIDTNEYIAPRELYWQIPFNTKSPIENPFQSETQFPFEVPIPAWLPRPWTRPGIYQSIGMEWQLEVSGRFARANVSATLPIGEIPQRLKQPLRKRIKIPQAALANFLAEQSILWERTVEPQTMTIVRNRPPFAYSMVIGSICMILSIGCGVVLLYRLNEFVVWLLLGSFVMLIATLGNRYVYRIALIDDGGIDCEDRFFGFRKRRSFRRDELLSVSVEPKKIHKNDDSPHVEFDIFVQTRGSKVRRMHLARIRTRLLAKAFAKAIANELCLVVVYQVSD